MIEKPMDVLQQHPVRKYKKQKQVFRDAVQTYAEGLGYSVTVEKGSLGSRNVVIGNPGSAKYLITAHYDTPAGMFLPNLLTPCNAVTFIGYQFLIVGIFVLAAALTGIAAGYISGDAEIGSIAAGIVYWGMLILMLAGPANKHNANDNTSGVITVLEIAQNLPEACRDQVCFVLFDLEEAGLIGSSSYQSKHKQETKNQIILNLDCVGDGNELMMFPTKKLKKDADKMAQLRSIVTASGEKTLSLREKGFAVYPSDQAKFPYGVGIAAFHRSKWAGLYCDKIHTNKDTVLEEANVKFLRDSLIRLIENTSKQ